MGIGRTAVVRALACATLLGWLAGCGASPSASPETATPTTSAPSPTTTPDQDGELVPPGLGDVPIPDLTATPKGTPPVRSRVYGADISWPQCPKGMGIPEKRTLGAPMPTAAARFVVIGLTNGPSFHPNPCLADQVAWARGHDLAVAAYAVVSYPDAATLRRFGSTGPYDGDKPLGVLRNVGYQAALFNLGSLRRAELPTPVIWVDVEPVIGFEWSADTVANAAVVEGTSKAYADAGFRVGFYSTPVLWRRVVGDLRLGGPEWRAAGQTSEAEALRRCAGDWSFQGGRGVLGQWVEDDRDRNLTCPGAVPDLRRWFGTF